MKKFKIVNKRKFVFSVFTIFISIFVISLLFCKSSYSSGDVKYKEIEVIKGDTLWSIAREENRNNEYYEGKDIRFVVYEIDKLNNIGNTILREGDIIKIPTI
ncbi:MAG: LysM peptidoglycan-binding domain-containing protein [Clostridia bacterium]|nr:LysM peptidoglycan-binding domain-containing protein [Clostridia bacterium]